MRVTVCELRTSAGALEQDWDGLVAHVAQQRSDLVVLPEMGCRAMVRRGAAGAGAWSLSSNSAEPEHGGLGWAIDPEGVVVATTSRGQPWVTVEVDVAAVEAAKASYPRYVPEL